MRRAQGALEFTLITGVMLIIFSVVFIVAQNNYLSIQEARFDEGVERFLSSIEQEIVFAYSAGEGYSRNVTFPHRLQGMVYQLFIRPSTLNTATELYVDSRGTRYLSFIPIPVVFEVGFEDVSGVYELSPVHTFTLRRTSTSVEISNS